MKNVIWKFPIDIIASQGVNMPVESEALCVQIQGGRACIWAECNQHGDKMHVGVYIYGTGNTTDEFQGNYLGTIQDGGFVWHVYIKGVPVK